MAFASGLNRPSARDAVPGFLRLLFFVGLSVSLMYFDQRDGWGERIRYTLQAVAYPIQVAIGSPRALWNATSGFVQSRATLQAENAALRERERELSLRAMRFEALEQENARLRGIAGALPPLVKRSQLAEVVNSDLGRLRQRLVLDHGERAGLFRSQAVVDSRGLMGQLMRVGPWSSELMLVTDPEAAVPVELLRNGLRTIAVGTGSTDELLLPYLPATADVKAGDVIVTSGLGGVFPAGVPVGDIIENRRNPDELLASVRAKPRASLDRSRQVLALWFDPASPAAPASAAELAALPEAPVAQPVTAQPVAAKPAAAKPPVAPQRGNP